MITEPVSADIKQILADALRLDAAAIEDTMTVEQLGLDSLAFAEVVIRCG